MALPLSNLARSRGSPPSLASSFVTPIPHFTTLGAGPTLLMLHDIGGGHLAFAPQVETFASAGYRAVAWDMPGYGLSAPVEPYTFKALAARCVALIEALMQPRGGGSVILLGQGLGGMVALEVMARRPDLVNRLVLGGAPARGADTAGLLGAADGPGDMTALATQLVPQLIGPGSLPEGVQLALRCMAEVNPSIWRRALECRAGFERSASLPLIRVPTLLVAGEFDREVPLAVLQAMAAHIPGSRLDVLRGVGHLHNLEAPDEFDAHVLDFLASTQRRPSATLH